MKRIVLTLCVFIALSSLANAAALIECYDPNTGKTIKTSNPPPGAICEGMKGGGDEVIYSGSDPRVRQQSESVRKADYYFNKAKDCVNRGGYVNTQKANVYRSIGESCLNTSGYDTSKVFSYYDQAESILESIATRCRHGAKDVSSLCVDRMIEQAVVLKRSGDAYLGIISDLQTEEVEKLGKKVKKLEREMKFKR